MVVVTGTSQRHDYVAATLRQSLDVRAIVQEQVYVYDELNRTDPVVAEHFALRDAAESAFFGGEKQRPLGIPALRVPKGDANEPGTVEWITSFDPDYLVLYGSSVIKAALLGRFPDRVVNMHLGLSPYYRGSGTNFWPLVLGEPECVGATIHLASPIIDGGGILAQVRPSAAPGDGCHGLGCRTIVAGADSLAVAIADLAAGRRRPLAQRGPGRLFRRRDFNSMAVRVMRRNLQEGMVADYLAHKSARDRQFPIVQ